MSEESLLKMSLKEMQDIANTVRMYPSLTEEHKKKISKSIHKYLKKKKASQ